MSQTITAPRLQRDHATAQQRIGVRPAVDHRYHVPAFIQLARFAWRVLNRPVEL